MLRNLHPSMQIAFLIIGLVFLALFSATYYTFKIALKDGPIEVVDKNYYQIGLNYEQAIKDKKLLKQEGYSFELVSRELHRGENLFRVNFKKGNKLLNQNSAYLILERGATDKFNRKINLQSDTQGYFTKLEIPSEGKWIVTVVANEQSKEFSETFVFQVD